MKRDPIHWLSGIVQMGPKNRKDQEFLQLPDAWVSHDKCEHSFIRVIPDGRRVLRRDRKNRNHFYFKSKSQTVADC